MAATSMRRTLKNVVKNYTSTEVKVREATSNDPWGPSSTLMGELADLTYNSSTFSQIMQMLFKRMNDHGKNWRHVYKALTLLEYLVKNGSEKVATQCKENLYSIQTLKDFQFVEDGKDHGANVREKAKDIVALLRDDERLRNERVKAAKTRERFVQGGTGSQSQDSASGNASPNGKSEEDVSNANATELNAKRSLAAKLSTNSTTRPGSNAAAGSNTSIDAQSNANANATDYHRSLPNLGAGEERVVAESSEELELQIALALSKQEHEREVERRKQEELRLQIALEASRREAQPQVAASNNQQPTTPVRLPMPAGESRRSSNKQIQNQRSSLIDPAAASTQPALITQPAAAASSKSGEPAATAQLLPPPIATSQPANANADLLGLDFSTPNTTPLNNPDMWLPPACPLAQTATTNIPLGVAFVNPPVATYVSTATPINGTNAKAAPAPTSPASTVAVASPKRSSNSTGSTRKVSAAKALAGVQPIAYPTDPWHTAGAGQSQPAAQIQIQPSAAPMAKPGDSWEAFEFESDQNGSRRTQPESSEPDPFGDSFAALVGRVSVQDTVPKTDTAAIAVAGDASSTSTSHSLSEAKPAKRSDQGSLVSETFDILSYRSEKPCATPKRQNISGITCTLDKLKNGEPFAEAEDDDSEWVTVKDAASSNDLPTHTAPPSATAGISLDPFDVSVSAADKDPFRIEALQIPKRGVESTPLSASFSTQFDELAALAASRSAADRFKSEQPFLVTDSLFGADFQANLSPLVGKPKTADQFLGENASLVNLENLITKPPPGQPSGDAASQGCTNPFSGEQEDNFVFVSSNAKPTLNDLANAAQPSTSQSGSARAVSPSATPFGDMSLTSLGRPHTPPAQQPNSVALPMVGAQPFASVTYATVQPRVMQPQTFASGAGMQMPAPVAIGQAAPAVPAAQPMSAMPIGVNSIPLANVPVYPTTVRVPLQGMGVPIYGVPPTIMYPQMGVAYTSQPIAVPQPNYGFGVALAAQPVGVSAALPPHAPMLSSSPPTQSTVPRT